MKAFVLVILLVAHAQPLRATELFSAAGDWVGEGRLAISPTAPLERGRCRVTISPDAAKRDVSITGQCAVAAGLSQISLRLVRGEDGRVQAGVWTGATGQTVQFAGRESATTITMEATAPVLQDGVSYEARVEVTAPARGSFSMRQLMRGAGEAAWRLVAEMDYRPGG